MHKRMIMKQYVAIGIGGMVGAIARYSLSILLVNNNGFPYETLIANLIGCFLLSFLLHHEMIKKKLPKEIFTAISVGVIGSFTTFSTFAVETMMLWYKQPLIAMTYIMISIFGGLLFCYAGYRLAKRKQVEP